MVVSLPWPLTIILFVHCLDKQKKYTCASQSLALMHYDVKMLYYNASPCTWSGGLFDAHSGWIKKPVAYASHISLAAE